MRTALVTTLIGLALVAFGTTDARADAPVACSVIEIEASTGDAPVMDADLKPLEKKLKKPPFSSWNTFKHLGSQAISLEPMKAGNLTLKLGKASLLLREVTARDKKKTRISLGVTLDDAEGKRVFDSKLQVDAGDYLVVARSMKGNKAQLVAMSCKP
jgi:hypothetical protein